jgi:hypothetical protein
MILKLKLGMSSMLISLLPSPRRCSDVGKSAVIVRALYELKSVGTAFGAHLASFMRQMGYSSCKADPDLLFKAETRPDDNFRYYTHILLCQ